jgi:hypothetical protein
MAQGAKRLLKNSDFQAEQKCPAARRTKPEEKGVPARYVVDEG